MNDTVIVRVWADVYTDVEVDTDKDGNPEFDPSGLSLLVEDVPITDWQWDGLTFEVIYD